MHQGARSAEAFRRGDNLMRKFVLGALVALVSTAALADNPPLRIGVIGPLTGGSADFGVPMVNGIKLAVDEINAVGGYLGRKLELVIKDDEAKPDVGLAQGKAMVAEKVVATIGYCNTG